jgi:hypothetical protein
MHIDQSRFRSFLVICRVPDDLISIFLSSVSSIAYPMPIVIALLT